VLGIFSILVRLLKLVLCHEYKFNQNGLVYAMQGSGPHEPSTYLEKQIPLPRVYVTKYPNSHHDDHGTLDKIQGNPSRTPSST